MTAEKRVLTRYLGKTLSSESEENPAVLISAFLRQGYLRKGFDGLMLVAYQMEAGTFKQTKEIPNIKRWLRDVLGQISRTKKILSTSVKLTDSEVFRLENYREDLR